MLVQKLGILLLLGVTLAEFVFDNSLLKLGVGLLEVLVLPELVSDSADELLTDFVLLGEIMEVVLVFRFLLGGGRLGVVLGVLAFARATALQLGALRGTVAFRAGSVPGFTFGVLARHAIAALVVATSSSVLKSLHGLPLGFASDLVFGFLLLPVLLAPSSGGSLLDLVVLSVLGILDFSSGIGEDI